jgi:hypothetical protein
MGLDRFGVRVNVRDDDPQVLPDCPDNELADLLCVVRCVDSVNGHLYLR